MPIYTYKCKFCGREYEKFRSLSKRLVGHVCDCGQIASFILSAKSKIRDLYPFIDEYMDAKPVQIESLKHYRRELSKRNLQETGRRRGMKGQWV
jgi:putative FmdB family regulatory protein